MLLRYWVLIVGLGIGWGSSFYFNEILLRELGPLSVANGRVLLGAIGCWVWILARGLEFRVPRAVLGQLCVLSLLNYAIPFALYAAAQEHITSGAAGIINALMPVWVVVVSHFWPGGEKATLAKSIGVLFGFGGIVLLALPALQRGGGSEFWGVLAAAAAPVCYAFAVNYVRRLKSLDPAILTAWSLSCAAILLAPLSLWREGWPVITQAGTWGALAMIGFVLTSAAFILMFWLLPRVGATTASTITFVAPISAVLLGVWLLGEHIGAPHLMGMAAIFCGLLLIDGRVLRLGRRDPSKAG